MAPAWVIGRCRLERASSAGQTCGGRIGAVAVEESGREAVEAGALGPEEGRHDVAAGVDLAQELAVGGELAEVGDRGGRGVGRGLAGGLVVDEQDGLVGDGEAVDLAGEALLADGAADRLLGAAAGGEEGLQAGEAEDGEGLGQEGGAGFGREVGGDAVEQAAAGIVAGGLGQLGQDLEQAVDEEAVADAVAGRRSGRRSRGRARRPRGARGPTDAGSRAPPRPARGPRPGEVCATAVSPVTN